MGVYELYKPVRNKVALLSYDDSLYVIWAYSQLLQINGFQIPGDIQVHKDYLKLRLRQQWIAEWDLEALAKEVILNGSTVSAKRRTLRTWDTLAESVNELRGLEREIYGLYGSSENVLIELNQGVIIDLH